jgi:outer membrane receptor protein involved in Fe transport
LEYRPNSAWRLTAALAYNHAALIGPQPVTTDPQSQVKSGDRLANVPDWSGNFSIAWARPLGRNDRLGIRLDAQFQSSRDTTVAKRSAAYERLGGFWLADAHLEFARGRDWQLSLDVTNLFNRYALLSGKALDSNLVQTVTAARPRTAAMRVSWRL